MTAGARDELARPVSDLAFSALAAGLGMGLSALAVAFLANVLPSSLEPVTLVGYPLGFIAMIIGRQQLFTENTLFPVALLLKERHGFGVTARLWLVVLVGNVLGAIAFAVFAGWLIALVAWLVTASTDTTAQILCVLLLTYVVGLGQFAHSIAGSAEVLSAVVGGTLGVGDYLRWLLAAVAGNVVGGVIIVALINYAQVRARDAQTEPEPSERRAA